MLNYATEARRKELAGMPGGAEVVKLMAAMMPRSYNVTGINVGPDGNAAVLSAAGMGTFMGSPQQMYGTVNFLKENNEWKVDKWEWSSTKPAAALPATPARVETRTLEPPALKKPVPEPTPAGATTQRPAPRDDCQVKPVMTDEDLKRCGAATRSGSEPELLQRIQR